MQKTEEMTLIHRAQQGDLSAYETLIQSYETLIYNLCLRMLKDQQEAYDAAQEVCLKIWRQLGTYKGKSKLTTWIYRLTTNQCLDILRKNKKKQEVSLYIDEEDTEEKLAPTQSVWEDVSEHMMHSERQRVLWEAIDSLKEEYRIALLLRDIEGRSYEEIASILELSLGTVKSRISRARLKLKKILEQDREPYRSFFRHIK